jgi:hypothetical protein
MRRVERFTAAQLKWMTPRQKQQQARFVTTFTPTAFTFTTVLAATSYASSTTPNATINLDLSNLSTSYSAYLYPIISRNVGTALTRPAYFGVRRSFSSSATIRLPQNPYDFPSSIATANATTVSSGGAAGATTMVLASGTGFAAQQLCTAQLAGARCESFSISNLTSATITIDDANGFKIAHNASDVVTNGTDAGGYFIPGGDLWYIQPINNSGQTVIMQMYAETYVSDTGT